MDVQSYYFLKLKYPLLRRMLYTYWSSHQYDLLLDFIFQIETGEQNDNRQSN